MLERAARLLQVCMLIVVLSLMSRWGSPGITTRSESRQVLECTQLWTLALLEFRAHLHLVSDSAFVLLRPAAYNLAAFDLGLLFSQIVAAESGEPIAGVDLQTWNNAVTGYIDQWYRRYWS